MANVENAWAKAHPAPEFTINGNMLSLWNYPVGKAELAPEHQQDLYKFMLDPNIRPAALYVFLNPANKPEVRITIRGFASDTGSQLLNQRLSQRRAMNVRDYLIGLGFKVDQKNVTWEGSIENANNGNPGLDYAHNRRVDVTSEIIQASQPLSPTNLGDLPPAPAIALIPIQTTKPPDTGIKLPENSSVTVEIPIEADLPPIKSSEATMESKVEGTLQVKLTDKSIDGVGVAAVVKDGELTSVKLENELTKEFVGKFSLQLSSKGKPPVLKFGVEIKDIFFKPEIGVQAKINPVYMNFTITEAKLPDIEIDNLQVSMTFKGKLKCEFRPGPAMLARFARIGEQLGGSVSPIVEGAAPIAESAGPIFVAWVIAFGGSLIGIALLGNQAKVEGLRYSRLLAQRNGAAARVALDVVGGDYALGLFKDLRLQYDKLPDVRDDFYRGVKSVENMINGIERGICKPDMRKVKDAEWKAKFAADGTEDFTVIRKRVFEAVGGYKNDGEALTGL